MKTNNKKIYSFAVITICSVLILSFCVLLSGCGDKAFEGTWKTSPADNEKIKNANIFNDVTGDESTSSFLKNSINDAFSMKLTLNGGLDSKATLDIVGMTQDGSWKSSNANEGELTIGKTTANFTREGDKLTLSNGKISIDFYREQE